MPVRNSQHRIVQIIVSAGLVLALLGGYIIADIFDVVRGPFTISREARDADTQSIRQAFPPVSLADKAVAQTPIESAAAQSLIDKLVNNPAVGSDISVIIMNADGSPAAEKNKDTLRQPASTLKTLTAVAAALSLDMGSTIQTSTYLIPVKDSKADEVPKLVLKGHGDMLLGSEANDVLHVNGRAGLDSLAESVASSLKKQSLTTIQLSYDTSFFGPERSPRNIQQNNVDGIYFTPTAVMAIDEGRVRTAQDKANNPDGKGVYVPRMSDPEAQVAQTFAQLLHARGITIQGEPTRETLTAGDKPIATVESAALGEIMAYMLRTSDNTLAELFGRLLAIKEGTENSPQGAVDAVLQVLKREGLPMSDVQLADCSGLSPGSLLSVMTLAAIQQLACDNNHGRLAPVIDGLSIVGLVGTASERVHHGEANGLVRVKTGTLSQVTSMTGNVLRHKGGILEFAVIISNPKDMGAAIQAVDAFMCALPSI